MAGLATTDNAAYQKEWRAENPEKCQAYSLKSSRKYRKVHRAQIREKRSWRNRIVNAIKREDGCQTCGESDSRCLEFHHRDPKTKVCGVGQIAQTRPWTAILAEMDKCNILCANCHKRLTITENL